MEVLKIVEQWQVDKDKHPRLWKAQIAFVSAEMLRKQEHLNCAANRYYYAMVNLAFQFLGERDSAGYDRGHGELMREYVRDVDPAALQAFSRAATSRHTADYTPQSVPPRKIALMLVPVAEALHRGLIKESERERDDASG